MRFVVTMLLLCGAVAVGQELPDAPSYSRYGESRTGDRAFWIAAGAYGASVAGDAITKSLWVGQSSGCSDVSPGVSGRSPRSARAGLLMIGEFAVASIASYEFKKHNLHIGKLRLWELPFVTRTYTHSRGIIHNLSTCR
jgi:hypothetical protein